MEPCASKAEIQEAIDLGKSAHKRLDEHYGRMEKIEENTEILHEMNTNIKLMVQKNDHRDKKLEVVEFDIKEIKKKPQEEFNKVKWMVITVIVTAIVTGIIANIPTILKAMVK